MNTAVNDGRSLGFWMCTALIVGNTIGIGIFLMPAALAPYGLNAIIGWVITVAGCVLLATVFAGLARSFPQDDGPYGYTRRAFGNGAAFIVLWCYWVSTCVTNSVISIGIVGYLSVLLPALDQVRALAPVAALTLVWLAVMINLRGTRAVGWMQILTTILKLTPLAAIILLGLFVLFTRADAYIAHPPANPTSLREIVTASTITLFAMLGIECAMIPAAKVKDPARTIPRATLAGALLTGFIYLSVSVIPMLLVPQSDLARSNAPFADLFARFVGTGYGEVLAVFIMISGMGALNGWTLMVGELTQSFARHGNFPAALGKVNQHASPARAFVLTGVVSSAMLLVNYNESLASGFTFLSVVVTAANLPLYLACCLSMVVLWRRRQLARFGRREKIWIAAAGLAVIYCVWVFVGVGGKSLLWAVVLGACGAPIYLLSPHARERLSARRVSVEDRKFVE